MIHSAEEFKYLRTSDIIEEYNRAAHDEATIEVWFEVIEKYPELKEWVIHNKTIQHEVLEFLVNDVDEAIRSSIARKRKIMNTKIFDILAEDPSENVRYSLACNTKNKLSDLQKINSSDSSWLQKEIEEIIKRKH